MGYATEHYDYHYDDRYETDLDKSSAELEIESRLDGAQEFFIALYEELTADKPLDLASIYSYMSEISGYLNVDERKFGDLTIARGSKIIQFAGV